MPSQTTETLLSLITSYEKQVWQALISGDKTADAALLSNDFVGVYPDGFAKKADHTDQLNQGPTVQSYTLDGLRIKRLGADHAVLSYRSRFRRAGKTTDEIMYVSSIWQREGNIWVNILSQDTPEQL